MSWIRPAPVAAVWSLLLALGAGCATRAHVDFDPNAPFDRYQTYAWLTSRSGLEQGQEQVHGEADPLLLRRIREAIDEGLAAKGYRRLDDPAAADFVVNFTVGAREKIRPTSSVGIGMGSYGSWGWGWGISAPVSAESYTEGTLAIDIFDAQRKEAVWHGRASRRVTESMDRAELVNDVVGAILKKFPPPR
jgi:hypothetical protein